MKYLLFVLRRYHLEMFIIMTTHQNVGSLKQRWDIFTVTELHKYLARYARLNQQHPKATIVASHILLKATIVAFSTEPVKGNIKQNESSLLNDGPSP